MAADASALVPSPSPSAPPMPVLSDRRRRRALLALLILSPGIAEYMTGSSPLTALIVNPPGFFLQLALNLALYGGGVVVIREVCVARRKGWASVLLLGAAYGIIEEGLAVHTFFQTSGNPVGLLGSYGHAWGVNWVWAVGLTTFHAVYSIALPILLVQLLYPEWAGRRLTSDRGLSTAAGLYVLDVVLIAVIAPSKPALGPFLLFLVLVGLLILLALRVRGDLLASTHREPDWKPTSFVLLGLVPFALWLFADAFAPALRVPPLVDVAIFVGVILLVGRSLIRHVGSTDPRPAQLAVAGGLLGALLPWDVLLDFAQNPAVLVVSGLAVVLLVRLRRRIESERHAVPQGAMGLLADPGGLDLNPPVG